MTPRDASALALGSVFASGGVLKLLGRGPGASLGERLGLSPGLLSFIGCCELAGGLGLVAGATVSPRLGAAAGAGLTALTGSGVVAHVRAGEPPRALLPALTLGAASAALARSFRATTRAPTS